MYFEPQEAFVPRVARRRLSEKDTALSVQLSSVHAGADSIPESASRWYSSAVRNAPSEISQTPPAAFVATSAAT